MRRALGPSRARAPQSCFGRAGKRSQGREGGWASPLAKRLEGQGPPASCPCFFVDGTQSWTLDLNWYLLGLREAPPTQMGGITEGPQGSRAQGRGLLMTALSLPTELALSLPTPGGTRSGIIWCLTSPHIIRGLAASVCTLTLYLWPRESTCPPRSWVPSSLRGGSPLECQHRRSGP